MIRFEEALNLTKKEVFDLSYKYQNPWRLKKMTLPLYVKGEGPYLWDDEGNRYLDMSGSVGPQAIGNCNEKARDALMKVIEMQIPGIQTGALHPMTAAFAANLAELSPGSLNHLWMGNCGTEAVEGALKIVQVSARNNKNKKRIISCNHAFHGRTLGSLSLMGDNSWDIYNQKIENHTYVPFNDIEALENELKKGDVIAFFVEPIQGEAGVVIPNDDYLPRARELCTKYHAWMVCDEIQSGFGRTGKLWCFENWDIVPDLCTFAKGYSAGYIPVAGYLASDELWDASYGTSETFFLHTNTYMEGALASAACMISLQELIDNNWMDSNITKGKRLLEGIERISETYPDLLIGGRGRGLWFATIFHSHIERVPEEVEPRLREGFLTGEVDKILLNDYHIIGRRPGISPWIRFLPTYDISEDDIDYFLDSLEHAVEKVAKKWL